MLRDEVDRVEIYLEITGFADGFKVCGERG